jgi:Cu-processing system permease protein
MTANKVLRYELRDLRRSRWILGYALLLLLLTDALLRFGGGGPRAVLSLLNVVLVFVPLVSIVFGAMYLYGARDFIELLLAQPVGRTALFAGLYGGLATPLAAAFVLGVGLPFLWGGSGDGSLAGPLAMLLAAGVLLTLVFTALAFLVSLLFEDRAKGLGAALLVWLAATALYDAVLVLVAVAVVDRSLELTLIGLTLLNPVDLGRVRLRPPVDHAAPRGFTGAVLERFCGSGLGAAITATALTLWCVGPLGLALRRFRRQDF